MSVNSPSIPALRPSLMHSTTAPEPPCCSIVFRWQACHFRNTCSQPVCHGGRKQVGYQLHNSGSSPGHRQNKSWAYYLGDTTKPFRFKSRSKREDCCSRTLFLPSRHNDCLRRHLRLMIRLFEYVVQVMTYYRYYSFQKMEVSPLRMHWWT